jgi:cytochrome bd-type quinol oxidase subunit 2
MDILTRFISLVDGYKTLVIVAFIMLDWILGMLVALLKTHDFQLEKIADYLNTDVVGMAVGYYVLGFVATLTPEIVAVAVVYSAFAALVISLGSMITAKIAILRKKDI